MRAIGIIFAALAGLAVAWPDQPSAAQSVAAQPAAGAAALRGAGSSRRAALQDVDRRLGEDGAGPAGRL